jgi:hypothetical protein
MSRVNDGFREETEMKSYKIFVACLVISLLVTSWVMPKCLALDEAETRNVIIQGEKDLVLAYGAVVEAECAGANVSFLVDKLGYAGELLAEANNAFRIGDYENAFLCAKNCSNVVAGVVGEAATLKVEAEAMYRERLFWTAVFSSAGLSVVFVLGLFVWRFLRDRYLKRILELKPEVGGGCE